MAINDIILRKVICKHTMGQFRCAGGECGDGVIILGARGRGPHHRHMCATRPSRSMLGYQEPFHWCGWARPVRRRRLSRSPRAWSYFRESRWQHLGQSCWLQERGRPERVLAAVGGLEEQARNTSQWIKGAWSGRRKKNVISWGR